MEETLAEIPAEFLPAKKQSDMLEQSVSVG